MRCNIILLCVLCKNGLDKFGYRDVLLLRQFLTPNGLIIGHRQTSRYCCMFVWIPMVIIQCRLVSQMLSSQLFLCCIASHFVPIVPVLASHFVYL